MLNIYSTFNQDTCTFYGSALKLMGTKIEVLIVGEIKKIAEQCWTDIINEALRLERLLSKFDPESELYRINQSVGKLPLNVSDELWKILIECKHYYRLSKGYFDITLKDYTTIELNNENQTIIFADDDTEIDLGAIGKGYALESIQKILSDYKVSSALINFGNSSVLGIGTHPYGDCWPVGIENPFAPGETMKIMKLRNTTISTSGNSPSHTNHILNPYTGEYIENQKIISVKMAKPTDAEVLSTALMAAPDFIRKEIIELFSPEEYFIYSE